MQAAIDLLTDRYVLAQASLWLQDPTIARTYLVTVIKTFGSSPAPAGTIMAINSAGATAGSVSGGCIELDILRLLPTMDFSRHGHQQLDYGVSDAIAHRTGLTCGGQLSLLVEQLHSPAQIQPLLHAIDSRLPLRRQLCLATGEISLHAQGADAADFTIDELHVQRVFGPLQRLVLIGANHLAYNLAQLAHALAFEVIVCDPRPDFAPPPTNAPLSLHKITAEEAVRRFVTDRRCALIALSHNPNIDDAALADALPGPAYFVGALGSRMTAAKRKQRLQALGVADSAIDRLHSPVGLAINSRRPEEIAIAITAQLLALRHSSQPAARERTVAR